MFYNDPKFKVNFLKVTNPGKSKSIPFSGLPKKVLDRKPLRFSTVLKEPFDFIYINLKVLWEVQPFGQGNPCKIQGINPGQTIPSNRIYSIGGLFFGKILLKYIDLWPEAQNDNKPLTIDVIKSISHNDHIQTTSLNDDTKDMSPDTNLIYTSHIYAKNIKNKHRKAMTINDYSSKIGINKMHKNYAFLLKCKYVYVQNIVYVYIQNLSFGFDKDEVQRGWFGRVRPSNTHIYIYKIE